MRLIFTKSSLPLSVLIRWFLNSDCSHFAIVFNSEGGGLMFESNLLGTHPKFYKTASKHFTVVHDIELKISPDAENHIWDVIVDQFDGARYNFKGFAYFCWRAFLLKAFKKPLPKINPWSMPGSYLCEQVFYAFQDLSGEKIAVDLAMISPEDLYRYVKTWVEDGKLL